jgi:NAD+ diphosphatase
VKKQERTNVQCIPSINVPDNADRTAYWFIFRGNEIMISGQSASRCIPLSVDIRQIMPGVVHKHYLGSLDGRDCYCAEVSDDVAIPPDMTFSPLRPLLEIAGEDMFAAAGRAFQIVDWDRNNEFCGRCGSRLSMKSDERAKSCSSCGLVNYPSIAPAVIVAVVKDRTLLLAHSHRFQSGLYSVLAGFVEPGETLEECVHREVREEVGFSVTDVKYFGSMPWPFPNSLMVGFTAKYFAGEIAIDHSELDDAGWYSPESMPPKIPAKGTIARKLIDWFLAVIPKT